MDYVGATELLPVVAELSAAVWALASLCAQGGASGASPAALRFSNPRAAALVAGTCHPPPALTRICDAVLQRLSAAQASRGGRVWVVGWRPDTRHDWGARALALSQWGRDGYVARPLAVLAPELAGVARATPPTGCRARCALTTSSLTSRTLTTARLALVNGGRARRHVWRILCALRATCSSRPASTTAAPSAALTALTSSPKSIPRPPFSPCRHRTWLLPSDPLGGGPVARL